MTFLGGFTRFPVRQGTKLSMTSFVPLIMPINNSKSMDSSYPLFVFTITAIGGIHLFWEVPCSGHTYLALEIKSFLTYRIYLMTIVYHEHTYLLKNV
jgi:hypothetical protein